MLYESLAKPLLFRLDPERAHEEVSGLMALLAALPGAAAVLSALTGRSGHGLEKKVFGLSFPNPVGLAAGFDRSVSPFWQPLLATAIINSTARKNGGRAAILLSLPRSNSDLPG